MSVKGKFNKKAIKEEIKKLEKKLEEKKRSNQSAWDTYGSELACGGMIAEERELQNQIEILKHRLEPTELYKQLLEKTREHKNELIFNCGPDVAILLEGIEYDGEDYYWRLFDLHRGFQFSSCVGRIDYIKGKIDDDTYRFLYDIFKMNYERVLNNQDELSDKHRKEIEGIFK